MNKKALMAIATAVVAVQALATTVVTRGDGVCSIANEHVKAEFVTDGHYDLSQLTINGKTLVAHAGNNKLPWELTYVGPQGENPEVNASNAAFKECLTIDTPDGKALVFKWDVRLRYDDAHLVPLAVTISLPHDGELLEWDIETSVPQGWEIRYTDFPRIAIDRESDYRLIDTEGWGNDVEIPYPQKFNQTYPSFNATMQMVMMHNATGAVYYATEDRSASLKDYCEDVEDNVIVLHTRTTNSESWNKDGRYRLPWTTKLGFSPRGWEDAAVRYYRPFTYTTSWGSKTLRERNIPQWLLDTDVWFRSKGLSEEVTSAIDRAAALYGKGTFFHTYYWHNHPYDTHYPDYFPAKPEYPGLVTKIHKAGCRAVPYINGRLWDPDADSYKTFNGGQASCRKPDGTLYTEIYPTSNVLNTVTCPASTLWQDIITGLVDRIQGELKTDGVYIDQISCSPIKPCWNPAHGHPLGGGSYWVESYHKLINGIRASHLKPGNILFSEENCECYIDLFDIQLTVNTPHSETVKILPVFPIVYSDRVLTVGYTSTPNDSVNSGDFMHMLQGAFLYGSQLGWVQPNLLMRDECKREQAFFKELAQIRRNYHHVFNDGRYIASLTPAGDNPEVEVRRFGKQHVVQGAVWQDAGGNVYNMYVNMDGVAHTVDAGVKVKPYSATIVAVENNKK